MRSADLVEYLDRYARYVGSGYAMPSRRLIMQEYGRFVGVMSWARSAYRSCDVLLLANGAEWSGRISSLKRELLNAGLVVEEHVRLPDREIISRRVFRSPPVEPPVHWRFLAGYAEWIVESYQPKVIVTFSDVDVLAVFLKGSAEVRGAKLVNVAHSVIVPHPLKSMFCFDYYLVFGPSSIEGAAISPVRLGGTTMVETGSVLTDEQLDVPPGVEGSGVVFFSSWLYNSRAPLLIEYDKAARKSLVVFGEWARLRRDLPIAVKLHPLENPAIIASAVSGCPSVQLLDQRTPIRDALLGSRISVGLVTNAALESSLMRRPFVLLFEPGVLHDHLGLDTVFGRRAFTVDALDAAVCEAEANFPLALERCERFIARHIAFPYEGLRRTSSTIADICGGTLPVGAGVWLSPELSLLAAV